MVIKLVQIAITAVVGSAIFYLLAFILLHSFQSMAAANSILTDEDIILNLLKVLFPTVILFLQAFVLGMVVSWKRIYSLKFSHKLEVGLYVSVLYSILYVVSMPIWKSADKTVLAVLLFVHLVFIVASARMISGRYEKEK